MTTNIITGITPDGLIPIPDCTNSMTTNAPLAHDENSKMSDRVCAAHAEPAAGPHPRFHDRQPYFARATHANHNPPLPHTAPPAHLHSECLRYENHVPITNCTRLNPLSHLTRGNHQSLAWGMRNMPPFLTSAATSPPSDSIAFTIASTCSSVRPLAPRA